MELINSYVSIEIITGNMFDMGPGNSIDKK